MKRLAIICTHPIQYYAPLFKLIAESKKVEITVFYTWGEESVKKFDPGFKKTIEWDVPLLDGYKYIFLQNSAKSPGSSHFRGIQNPTIIAELEAFSPDIILVFGWAYRSHFKVIRHFSKKTPIWFRGDSTLIKPGRSWKNLLRSTFLTWLYSNINLAFYVGCENKKYYMRYGMKEEQLIFAPHAIDNERFANIEVKKACLIREDLNIKADEIAVLFAGKLETIKNPELLLNSFMNIGNSNSHLILVGDGSLENRLKALAKGNERIHFVGFQNQSIIPLYYHACDLFCLPSQSETWGLAVNEAMACGKAVLVSDRVGCASDLVKRRLNGDIFESNSIECLTQKLSILLKDKQLLKSYGEESRKIIQEWSFSRTCEQVLSKL